MITPTHVHTRLPPSLLRQCTSLSGLELLVSENGSYWATMTQLAVLLDKQYMDAYNFAIRNPKVEIELVGYITERGYQPKVKAVKECDIWKLLTQYGGNLDALKFFKAYPIGYRGKKF